LKRHFFFQNKLFMRTGIDNRNRRSPLSLIAAGHSHSYFVHPLRGKRRGGKHFSIDMKQRSA
jgi:hypothetical protein